MFNSLLYSLIWFGLLLLWLSKEIEEMEINGIQEAQNITKNTNLDGLCVIEERDLYIRLSNYSIGMGFL